MRLDVGAESGCWRSLRIADEIKGRALPDIQVQARYPMSLASANGSNTADIDRGAAHRVAEFGDHNRKSGRPDFRYRRHRAGRTGGKADSSSLGWVVRPRQDKRARRHDLARIQAIGRMVLQPPAHGRRKSQRGNVRTTLCAPADARRRASVACPHSSSARR